MVTGKTIYREWFRKWYRVWKWILIQDGSLKQISSLMSTIDQEQDDSGDEF